MLLVQLDSIPNGARLARPVFNPERPSMPLLQPGSELSPPIIHRLEDMQVPMVWVWEAREGEPDWEQAARRRAAHADQALAQAGALLTVLRAQLRRAERHGPREIKPGRLGGAIRALASEMSHAVAQEPPVFQLAWSRNDLAGHLVNTAYYALLLATNVPKYLRGQRHTTGTELWETLSQLCTAAALHDIGKLVDQEGLPRQVSYAEPNELSYVAADAEYREHVARGAEAFRETLHSSIVYAIAHHHQRFNGQGFPRQQDPSNSGSSAGMAGTRIHIFARITALANALDHLFGRDLKPFDAVSRLRTLVTLQHQTERFDPVLLNAAVRLIPPFPMGTQVTLSDGVPAMVVHNNVHSLCRPVVLPLPAPNALPAANAEPIDLRKARRLTIVEVAGAKVCSQLYDVPGMSPDPLDYWALREVLGEVPEASAQPVKA